MIVSKGTTYFTIVDAAKELGVSAKTVREYIQKGVIPPPPEIVYGVRVVRHFPREYMEMAKEHMERYRTYRKDK